MEPITAALMLGPAIYKMGSGIYQGIKARQLGKTPRPDYEIPQSLKAALLSAERDASRREMPGQGRMEEQMLSGTAGAMSNLKQAADSPAAILGNVTKLAEGQRNTMADLGIASAEYQQQSEANLRQMLGVMADQEKQKWAWEKQDPYLQTMAAAQRMNEASNQNFFGGLTGAMGGLGVMSHYGMFKRKGEDPPPTGNDVDQELFNLRDATGTGNPGATGLNQNNPYNMFPAPSYAPFSTGTQVPYAEGYNPEQRQQTPNQWGQTDLSPYYQSHGYYDNDPAMAQLRKSWQGFYAPPDRSPDYSGMTNIFRMTNSMGGFSN